MASRAPASLPSRLNFAVPRLRPRFLSLSHPSLLRPASTSSSPSSSQSQHTHPKSSSPSSSSKQQQQPPAPPPEAPQQPQKKTQAQLDEELRLRMQGLAGDGGEAGIEYEDGQPVAMKRGVKNNMFRYI